MFSKFCTSWMKVRDRTTTSVQLINFRFNRKSTDTHLFLIYRSINDLLKILVICNDEFSMLAIQLLIYLIQLDNDNEPPKILFALAALKDDGLIWYKKNMPQ